MTRIHDVTVMVSPEMLIWPGDPPVEIRRTSQMAAGDTSNVSQLVLGSHTGTHVDAPAHFIDGATGVEQIPLDAMNGPAFVADARGLTGALSAGELDGLAMPPGTQRLLIRSDNSQIWQSDRPSFPDSYVCLAPDGAQWCVDRGLRAVGVDFLSVEQKGSEGHPTHVTLLRAGIAIIEGLNLSGIESGVYDLICMPLRLQGCDGSPARVALAER